MSIKTPSGTDAETIFNQIEHVFAQLPKETLDRDVTLQICSMATTKHVNPTTKVNILLLTHERPGDRDGWSLGMVYTSKGKVFSGNTNEDLVREIFSLLFEQDGDTRAINQDDSRLIYSLLLS